MTMTWPAVSLAAAMLVERLVLRCRGRSGSQVAGVGVAAVAAEVGQDVGADGDRLRLELLEAPVHALGAGAARRAQLDGDSPGTVSATYCSSGSVLTVRAWPAEL